MKNQFEIAHAAEKAYVERLLPKVIKPTRYVAVKALPKVGNPPLRKS